MIYIPKNNLKDAKMYKKNKKNYEGAGYLLILVLVLGMFCYENLNGGVPVNTEYEEEFVEVLDIEILKTLTDDYYISEHLRKMINKKPEESNSQFPF